MSAKDDSEICRWCGEEIPPAVQNAEWWDGETCSLECADKLDLLSEQLWDDWDDEDDEWVELDAKEREED